MKKPYKEEGMTLSESDRALPTIVRYIAHPQNEGFEPTEEQAWNLLGELANEFTDCIGNAPITENTPHGEIMGMRRASVLFHQMVIEARKQALGLDRKEADHAP